jgi:hypothetical protein
VIAKKKEKQIHKGKMSSVNLTDLVVALLHQVAGPCHRHRGRHSGWCHRHQAPAPPPSALAPSNPRVLERTPSPSSDRLAYRSMEPSGHDASPRGCHGRQSAIHRWGPFPNPIVPAARALSWGHEGEEEGKEDEEEPRQISVVLGLLQRPLTCQMVRKTISLRGGPQGQLAPRTTTSPASPSPSLVMHPALAPPPCEASASGSDMPPDLKILCGNRIIRQLAHFTSPIGKGRAPGS